jgi:uncharacterized protein YajQ (UPF0234 family)
MVALKNAVDVAGRQIDNRYDFKGTSAKVELNEKDKVITCTATPTSSSTRSRTSCSRRWRRRRRKAPSASITRPVQKISGNKVKQELKIKIGIEQELAKKIVKLIKDSKLKVQASDPGRRGARHRRQARRSAGIGIALVKKSITDFPDQVRQFPRLNWLCGSTGILSLPTEAGRSRSSAHP